MSYVAIGFNSLPRILKRLIESGNEAELLKELEKLKYSFATKKAARHYFSLRDPS